MAQSMPNHRVLPSLMGCNLHGFGGHGPVPWKRRLFWGGVYACIEPAPVTCAAGPRFVMCHACLWGQRMGLGCLVFRHCMLIGLGSLGGLLRCSVTQHEGRSPVTHHTPHTCERT